MKLRAHIFLLAAMLAAATSALAKVAPRYVLEERPSVTIALPENKTIANSEEARFALSRALNIANNEAVSLVLVHEMESPLGHHYTFNQFYQGVEVWQGSVRLHTGQDRRPFLVQSTLAEIADIAIPARQENTNRLIELKNGFIWGQYSVIEDERGVPYEQLSIDNEIVWQQEGRMHYQVNDTTVFGYVYLPNPVYSAKVMYGPPYVDSSDADTRVLRDERKLVQFTAKAVGDTIFLENSWLKFRDLRNPVTPVTFSVNDSFLFNRSEPGFEDVNAYYHLTSMADYVISLGYTNLISGPILLDAHGQFGQDNSSFNYMANPVELEYGTGGVDDAEDGQVIVHELTHAMSHRAAPFTFEGSERRAMEEGNADYFSVSYSRQFGDYNWQSVFSWDGHNEFWDGFSAMADKNYKTDLKGIMNEDREIWSACMMCIYEKLGRDITDSLVLSHFYLQAKNTTMPQMARVMLKVDTLQWQGTHYEDIKSCFVHYGMLEWGLSVPDARSLEQLVKVTNAFDWANNRGKLNISVLSDEVNVIRLYDITGKIVYSLAIRDTGTYLVPSSVFSPGIYILEVATPASKAVSRLFHY